GRPGRGSGARSAAPAAGASQRRAADLGWLHGRIAGGLSGGGQEDAMRILMISDFYHPFVGGVEQHVRGLAAELSARGHTIAGARLWREGLAEIEDDGGVRVYRLRGAAQRATWLFRQPGRPWAPPLPDPEIAVRLRHVIARERPEIVHGHDWLARS